MKTTSEMILELKREELKMMEMGAALVYLLKTPLGGEELVKAIQGLRTSYGIEVKATRTIRGVVCRYEGRGFQVVSSVNFINVIKWVREITRKVDPTTGEVSIIGLRDAKELVESWIGLTTFEIPLEWNLSLWPLPAGFVVVD